MHDSRQASRMSYSKRLALSKTTCSVLTPLILLPQWPAVGSWQHPVRGLLCGICLLTQLPLFTAMARILRSGFGKPVVKDAVDDSMKAIGLGLLLTAVLV